MKSLIGNMMFILFLLTAPIVQAQHVDEMPVTSKSQKALKLYQEGIQELRDVHEQQAFKLFKEAVDIDSTFFMPNYMLAVTNIMFLNNREDYQVYYQNAVRTNDQLNKGELLMQLALEKLGVDSAANVTYLGTQLVELYPKSFAAHEILAEYQYFAKDYDGMDRTLNSMLDLGRYQAPVYNWLGYNYMNMNKMDKARDAFEKYIALAPENPNSYDSMGDYLMAMKEYQKAYEHYMKAYKMDSVNFKISHEKALKAKASMSD